MNIVDGLFTGFIVKNYYLYSCLTVTQIILFDRQPIRAVIIL